MRSHFPYVREEDLVLAALLGDLEAYDELVRRYRGAVVFVAEQILGTREAAEDAAQDAFLLAFKALPQLTNPAKFAGWLYAITRRRAQRLVAQEERCRPAEPSEIDRLILAHSRELAIHPEESMLRRHEHHALATALASLPEEVILVLHLRYHEEWPVARIADFLLLPITTVKWRLHQGRTLLRRRLHTREEQGNDRQP